MELGGRTAHKLRGEATSLRCPPPGHPTAAHRHRGAAPGSVWGWRQRKGDRVPGAIRRGSRSQEGNGGGTL